uniref:tRNA-uridine aminocarboxypropyltransferase n=1 Tax=Parascaris univalens TaxID=6257 RepID=A0A915AU15_PARUN
LYSTLMEEASEQKFGCSMVESNDRDSNSSSLLFLIPVEGEKRRWKCLAVVTGRPPLLF